jgi:hypothetical protein
MKHIIIIAAKEGETWVNRFASIIKSSLSSAIYKRHSLMVLKPKAALSSLLSSPPGKAEQ